MHNDLQLCLVADFETLNNRNTFNYEQPKNLNKVERHQLNIDGVMFSCVACGIKYIETNPTTEFGKWNLCDNCKKISILSLISN